MTRPVTCPINSAIRGHHSFSFESWHTELPAQTDAHWTVQLLMGHATKTLNQGGSVSGSMSWVLFLDTASFGRSKTMIRLANYEGITRELSDLEACFYWLHRWHSVTSSGSPGSWLTSPLCTWKRWGPAKRALSTLQFNEVCFLALGGLPHIRSETRWGHALELRFAWSQARGHPRARLHFRVCHLLWSGPAPKTWALGLSL